MAMVFFMIETAEFANKDLQQEILTNPEEPFFETVNIMIHNRGKKVIVEFDETTEEEQYMLSGIGGASDLTVEEFNKYVAKYVLKPLSHRLTKGFLSNRLCFEGYQNIAYFVAPNAYAIDLNWPHGKLSIDGNPENGFHEIHVLSKNYRYLFKSIRELYAGIYKGAVEKIDEVLCEEKCSVS